MSTRCNIEIYDVWDDKEYLGARLYHHSDGYPEFMQGKLERFLNKTYEILKEAGFPYWWDSSRVVATMIMLSIEDYTDPLLPFSTDRGNDYEIKTDCKYRPNKGIPVFQPCIENAGDIEYLWKVVLFREEGKYKISHKEI